jgi:hypothetical protein
MAVKPITNKQVVNKQSVNRAEQVSTKNSTVRDSNPQKSYTPGLDYTKNFAVTLKDIDKTLITHIKNVMKIKVNDNGVSADVPVLYANQERWSDVRKNNILKDKNGAIVLPLILLKRTNVDKREELPVGMEHDVTGKYTQVVRNSSWSKDNRYDRFAVQTGIKPKFESVVTGVPDYVTVTYEFILWTNLIEQMNVLQEAFVEQNNQYWGDSNSYKFHCKMEGMADATEMTVDTERLVKSTFQIITSGYLLPEYVSNVIVNKVSQTKRQLSPSKVSFNFNGDATNKQVKK